MTLRWPDKDPDEVLDYSLDLSVLLDGDTIDTITWTVPEGLTKDSQAVSGDVATVWLSGGEAGERYDIGCLIETAAGRTHDRTIRLRVKER